MSPIVRTAIYTPLVTCIGALVLAWFRRSSLNFAIGSAIFALGFHWLVVGFHQLKLHR